MVATDIAARGIDISDLGTSSTTRCPRIPAVYLHRVGRTGRIGKKGTAINLISGRELGTFTALEKKYGINFEKRQMPAPEEAHADVDRAPRPGDPGRAPRERLRGLPRRLPAQLKQRPDADDAIAFLLKYFFGHLRMEKLKAAGGPMPEPAPARPPRERERPRGDRPRREERGERGERGARPERRERSDCAERSGPPRERRERGERPPRRDRTEEGTPPPAEPSTPGQVRLWMNVGSAEGLDVAGITAMLEGLGAPAGKVQRVDLKQTYSYAFVAEEDAPAFEKLDGQKRGEKSLRLERARRRWSERLTAEALRQFPSSRG